ncbi:MAG: hypothetical protein HWN67_10780, partial [Candidatus Helarchaeota archaeon]|nr:hypothetical protein [Candidatus Helarchaeota archaeon]
MDALLPLKKGLEMIQDQVKTSKSLKEEIYIPEIGYKFNKNIQITTRSGDTHVYIKFKDGEVSTGEGKIDDPDLTIVYRDLKKMASSYSDTADKSMDNILSGDLYCIGNFSVLVKFTYILNLFLGKRGKKSKSFAPDTNICDEQAEIKKLNNVAIDRPIDNVKYLKDPYLGRYALKDFPRILNLKNRWFKEHPWICDERAKNLTEFHRNEGFEVDVNSNPWHPGLRQGLALKYILSKKTPNINEDDLIPGSTTSLRLGVQMYPEFGGVGIWPELKTIQSRRLNPYHISKDTRKILNKNVFPFWMDRNVREQARQKFNNPMSQRLDEFFCLYFMWKTQAISHTIP